jgi:hypothetical protein
MKIQFLFCCAFMMLASTNIKAQYYDPTTGKTIPHYEGPAKLPFDNSKPLLPKNNTPKNTSTEKKVYNDGNSSAKKNLNSLSKPSTPYYILVDRTDEWGNVVTDEAGKPLKNAIPFYYPEGASYTGEKSVGGAPNGLGRMTYANGTFKEGEWDNGFFIGKEKEKQKSKPDPDHLNYYGKEFSYNGQLDAQGLPGGYGTAYDTNKDYSATWVMGHLLAGNAEIRYYNGEKFTGNINTKVQPLSGTYTWPGGISFTGEFKNGIPTGVGLFVLRGGDFYSGYVKDTFMNGYGKLYNADGILIKEGIWQSNKFLQDKKDSNQSVETIAALKIKEIKDRVTELTKNNPVHIFSNATWTSIDKNAFDCLLVTKADGSKWKLGQDYFYNNKLVTQQVARDNNVVKVAGPNEWKTIKSVSGFSIGLKIDGSVWQWESGNAVQKEIGREWIDINITGVIIVLIKNDSTLWTCLRNEQPKKFSADNGWVKIFCGDDDAFAQKKDGTVWGWGNNTYGKLGIGFTFQESEKTPTQLTGFTNCKDISCGADNTFFIREDGTLWACGKNTEAQLGIHRITSSPKQEDHPIQVGNDADWIQVSAGYEYSLALKKDGSLWAWGKNSDGCLGVASGWLSYESDIPVRVGKDKDWKTVAAGYKLSFALKNDGSLWEWGSKKNWIKE